MHSLSPLLRIAQEQVAAYQSRESREEPPQKKEFVDSGRSHGILVSANGEPVGWCQYGPKEELPRIDN
jgi:hypothetical protein